jgi:hypothetical protein
MDGTVRKGCFFKLCQTELSQSYYKKKVEPDRTTATIEQKLAKISSLIKENILDAIASEFEV